MKKLVFAFFATVAMTFAACGGQTEPKKVATDSDSIVITDSIEVVDSVVADSAVAE